MSSTIYTSELCHRRTVVQYVIEICRSALLAIVLALGSCASPEQGSETRTNNEPSPPSGNSGSTRPAVTANQGVPRVGTNSGRPMTIDEKREAFAACSALVDVTRLVSDCDVSEIRCSGMKCDSLGQYSFICACPRADLSTARDRSRLPEMHFCWNPAAGTCKLGSCGFRAGSACP